MVLGSRRRRVYIVSVPLDSPPFLPDTLVFVRNTESREKFLPEWVPSLSVVVSWRWKLRPESTLLDEVDSLVVVVTSFLDEVDSDEGRVPSDSDPLPHSLRPNIPGPAEPSCAPWGYPSCTRSQGTTEVTSRLTEEGVELQKKEEEVSKVSTTRSHL